MSNEDDRLVNITVMSRCGRYPSRMFSMKYRLLIETIITAYKSMFDIQQKVLMVTSANVVLDNKKTVKQCALENGSIIVAVILPDTSTYVKIVILSGMGIKPLGYMISSRTTIRKLIELHRSRLNIESSVRLVYQGEALADDIRVGSLISDPAQSEIKLNAIYYQ